MSKPVSFVYIMYTDGTSIGKTMLYCYKSNKAAKCHFDKINGEVIPIGMSNRVMQKTNNTTGQYWYVEKHVLRDVD